MNNINVMIGLFPMLFMFHDFEEIIFMQWWIRRNRRYLSERFPNISKRLLPHFDSIKTSSFAAGVAEEFLLIIIITIISYVTDWHSLWIGMFIAFTLHLLIHCFQALIIRKYVPALITSIICLPICLYIIKYIVKSVPFNTVVLYSILVFIIMVVNLIFVQKGMNIFSNWITKFEQQSK